MKTNDGEEKQPITRVLRQVGWRAKFKGSFSIEHYPKLIFFGIVKDTNYSSEIKD